MSRRKIEDETDARSCLAAMEAEGGAIRSWARAHGIDGRSLHAWRMNFAKWGDKVPASRARRTHQVQATMTSGLVELVPAAQARVAPGSSRTGRYVLEVGGARLEFDDNFSEPTLRRVLGVLRSC